MVWLFRRRPRDVRRDCGSWRVSDDRPASADFRLPITHTVLEPA
jgi:hypothetical protein